MDTIVMSVLISYLVMCLIMGVGIFIWLFLKWLEGVID